MNKEQELKQQFLQEVAENIQQIEDFFQKIRLYKNVDNKNIEIEDINNSMRAAHSIKGGSALMGLPILSEFAHRWEDYLKVLKVDRKKISFDDKLIELCFRGVDCLRQLVAAYADDLNLTAEVIAEQFQTVFTDLSAIFGEPEPEDMTTILATDSNAHEAIALLFETQIELSLRQLNDLIASDGVELAEELMNMAVEFDGLGQMFEIERFTLACESVVEHLTTATNQVDVKNIAYASLNLWRECQQAILANNYEEIPTSINLTRISFDSIPATSEKLVAANINHTANSTTNIATNITTVTPSADTFILASQTTAKTTIPATEPHLRVPTQQLETIGELSREITVSQYRLEYELQELQTLNRNLQQIIRQLDLAHQQTQRHWQKQTNFPHLTNSLQTTITAIAKLKEISIDIETHIEDAIALEIGLEKTARNMQTRINQVAMRPLADLFDRFPRALTELCQTYGKDVKLKIQGGDILVERTVIDSLNEPLTHLFRNAFDHGIETPQQRQTAGKPTQGTIEITAQQQHKHIIITIRDDGNGIDLNKICDRAILMGLDPILLNQASEADLLSLIFEPGFSTNDTVTELSGRGVGMDVVRNNIKQIQGDVKLETKPGIGTTFTLTLPLQTSLIRVLLIESDSALVAIPKSSVQAILPYSPNQVYTITNQDYFTYQDTIVTLINLADCWQFNTTHRSKSPTSKPSIDIPMVIIVEVNDQLIALQVERYWQEQEVMVRPVEGNIPLPSGFSNTTILRDGRVVPLLNLSEMLYAIASCQHPQQHPQQKTLPPQPDHTNQINQANKPNKPTILLVDDSVNVRRLIAYQLEQNGYHILEAKNGIEAFEQIKAKPQINAIISDIDMPQLDGYGLLEKLQSSNQFSNIPVLMLTSHGSPKYRQKAFNLGAKAYLKKPCNWHELAQALSGMLN